MPQGLTKIIPGSSTPVDAWGSPLAAAWVEGLKKCVIPARKDKSGTEKGKEEDAVGVMRRLLCPILWAERCSLSKGRGITVFLPRSKP